MSDSTAQQKTLLTEVRMTSAAKPKWKLSRSAIARVFNPLPIPHACPYCLDSVKATGNEDIYGKPYGDWPWVYLCQNRHCGAYVGMHPRTNLPLGTLANAVTRNARKRAKEQFNEVIGPGKMSRIEAYEWLARQLDIVVSACHFALFDVEMCDKVLNVLSIEHARANVRRSAQHAYATSVWQ